MAGHSKWANIKHRKAAQDAKKAGVFTKLAKDIVLAAKNGSDPEINFRLKLAIDKARAANMPKDNIERSIKKGSGEDKDAASLEEVVYEGYGPGQVAMLIKTVTDNKNRTVSEVKHLLNKNGGKFSESGGVSWQFDQVGQIIVEPQEGQDSEELEMKILETSAQDYQGEEGAFRVFTQPQDLQITQQQLQEQGLQVTEAELAFRAKNKVEISDSEKQAYEKLLEALEEQEDVSEIYDNLA
jgi:YebC/PmpR family DNA-binding regulatory protein